MFVAERFADRLDVLDRFRGRVAAAGRPELQCTTFEQRLQLAQGDAGASQRGAAERARLARSALVEDDQVAVLERRRDRLREVAGER